MFYAGHCLTAAHTKIRHTVLWLSLAARINRRRRRRPFTLILGKLRVQHGYQTGIQRELKDAQSSNSNLNLFTFTFHFHYLHQPYQLTQQMNFSPVNKTMCPLECAALTSRAFLGFSGYPFKGIKTGQDCPFFAEKSSRPRCNKILSTLNLAGSQASLIIAW
jgi:hypothetical protein